MAMGDLFDPSTYGDVWDRWTERRKPWSEAFDARTQRDVESAFRGPQAPVAVRPVAAGNLPAARMTPTTFAPMGRPQAGGQFGRPAGLPVSYLDEYDPRRRFGGGY